MKMRIHPFIIALLFLGACNNEENSENPDNVLLDSTAESQETQIMEDPIVEVRSYELIEDYAQIGTRGELYTLFDEEDLEDDTTWYAEGTVMMETTNLTNPDNGHIIKFVWNEGDRDELAMIEVSYYIYNEDFEILRTQNIHSDCGLYSGMSLEEYRTWNDAPFNFSGFDWDYGGGIFVEENSKASDCPVWVELTYDYNTDYEEIRHLLGDIELNSDAAEVKTAPIFIGKLTLSINPEE